jgi:hypothetical protein
MTNLAELESLEPRHLAGADALAVVPDCSSIQEILRQRRTSTDEAAKVLAEEFTVVAAMPALQLTADNNNARRIDATDLKD